MNDLETLGAAWFCQECGERGPLGNHGLPHTCLFCAEDYHGVGRIAAAIIRHKDYLERVYQ